MSTLQGHDYSTDSDSALKYKVRREKTYKTSNNKLYNKL